MGPWLGGMAFGPWAHGLEALAHGPFGPGPLESGSFIGPLGSLHGRAWALQVTYRGPIIPIFLLQDKAG